MMRIKSRNQWRFDIGSIVLTATITITIVIIIIINKVKSVLVSGILILIYLLRLRELLYYVQQR